MEFENFSSVKAKTRRRTPEVIRSSTWAFTFSTPPSANTTGVVSERVAPLTGVNKDGHTVHRCERVGDSPRQDASREVVDHGMEIGARPVKQADDGGVDVPHLVGSRRSKAHLRLRRVHAEPGTTPAELPREVVPGRGEAQTLPSRCARTATVPVGTCRYAGEVTMFSIARTSGGVSRYGDVRGQDD